MIRFAASKKIVQFNILQFCTVPCGTAFKEHYLQRMKNAILITQSGIKRSTQGE